MSFGEAIGNCFRKYATFSGRAKRPEYWWFFLLNFLLGLIPVIGTIWGLVVLIPSFAVLWRRMHDIGKPGYYGLAPYIAAIPGGIGAVLQEQGQEDAAMVLIGVAVVYFIVATIVTIVRLASPSEPGPNRFGGDVELGNVEQVFN